VQELGGAATNMNRKWREYSKKCKEGGGETNNQWKRNYADFGGGIKGELPYPGVEGGIQGKKQGLGRNTARRQFSGKQKLGRGKHGEALKARYENGHKEEQGGDRSFTKGRGETRMESHAPQQEGEIIAKETLLGGGGYR